MLRAVLECDGTDCDASIEVRDVEVRPLAFLDQVRSLLAGESWSQIMLDGRCRVLCPRCSRPLGEGTSIPATFRRGMTLVELLVVLAIVGIVAAVTGPYVMNAIRGSAVKSSAQALQGAITAAREAALKDRAPKGLRIMPDSAWILSRDSSGQVDPARALAGGRAFPLEAGPGYSDGKVAVRPEGPPAGFAAPPSVLLLEAEPFDAAGMRNDPTSWANNVRVGDTIKINEIGPVYWVVGPMVSTQADANVERFVNYGPTGPALDRGDGAGPREYLYLVNGIDDDGDGWIDPGFDGVDGDGINGVDDAGEWAEVEQWHPPHRAGLRQGTYILHRRPIPSMQVAVDLGDRVVDLTGWGAEAPPRSRVPVDPWTGSVELLIEPDGTVHASKYTSSPAWRGLRGEWIHLWIAERRDVQDAPQLAGEACLLSIHGKTGRIVATDVDPERPGDAFRAAETGGGGR